MDNIFLPKINFSKDYYKLHNQTSAKLIHVEELILNDRVSQEFLNYDTTAKDGSMYSLKKGRYLLLVFLGLSLQKH